MAKYGPLFINWARNYDDVEPTDVLKKAHAAGASCMELHTDRLDNYSDAQLMDFKKLAEDFGIEIAYAAAVPAYGCPYSDDPTVRQKGIDYITHYIKRQELLGGKIFDGSFLAPWPSAPADITFDREKLLETAAGSLKTMCKIAADHGQIITEEIYNRFEGFLLNTAKEAVALCEMVDEPNLLITFDTYHANIEEDSWEDCIRTLGKYCGHVHLGEANRKLPGSCPSKMDWNKIFSELNKLQYDGMFIFEAFTLDQGTVSRDVSLWRDLTNHATMEELIQQNAASYAFVKRKFEIETRG